MRKGITLIEILIVIAISSILIILTTSIFGVNLNVFNFISYEKEVHDYLRNAEDTIMASIRNAEELQILDNKPTTFDTEYNYLYSENGGVYFVKVGGENVNITKNAEEDFKIIFTKSSDLLLSIEINSELNSNHNKNTDVMLKNLKDKIETESSEIKSNTIKFRSNLPEILDVKITKFNFVKSENSNTNLWISNTYEGKIDNENAIIKVEVDEEVDLRNLKASIEHDGDEEAKFNTIPGENQVIDYRNTVYVEVSKGGISKKYRVIVTKIGVPQILEFGFRAKDNTHVKDSSGNQIPLSGYKIDASKFAANSPTNTYRDGSVVGVVGKDKMGYVFEDTREIFVSLDTIQGANENLVPYLKIKGEYIVINGQKVNATPTSVSGISEVIFTDSSGTLKQGLSKIDFNPGRTFTNYETAENPIGQYTGGTVSGENNKFSLLDSQDITVYETAADGKTIRSRAYEIFVSPYAYGGSLEKVDRDGNRIFKAWIDEKNLFIYMPKEHNSNNDRFRIKFVGSVSNVYAQRYYYWGWKGPFWLGTNTNDDKEVSDYLFTEEVTSSQLNNNVVRFSVYNQDVHDRTDYKPYSEIKDDQYEMDKFYRIIYQDAGIFKFHYENTESQNRYLYDKKVEAEIVQGSAQNAGTIGNNRPLGTINIKLPKNEYLDDMVASVTFMGDFFGNVNKNGVKTTQESEISENDIGNQNIKEYYVKSEISNKYYRYKFNVEETASPTIKFATDNTLLKSGTADNEIFTAPQYTYTKGENREEKTDGVKYNWYYVQNESDINNGTQKLLSCTENQFEVKKYLDEIPDSGYVYATIQTKSDTYTVDGDSTGYEYGGVETNIIHTTGREVTVVVDDTIKLDYVIYGEEGVNINVTNGFNGLGGVENIIHSNSGLTVKCGGIQNFLLQAVGNINLSYSWGGNGVKESIDKTAKSINFEAAINKKISELAPSKVADDKNKVTINYNLYSYKNKEWIVANEVKLSGYNTGDGPINIKAEKIDLSSNYQLNRFGSSSDYCILYHYGTDDLKIKNVQGFQGLIYAPNAKIIIDSTSSVNFVGGIYGKEVEIKAGNVQIKHHVNEIQ